MSIVTTQIRKAIVTKCMAHGIENPDAILMVTVKSLRNLGKMSAAGYKAHATRRRHAIRRRLRR